MKHKIETRKQQLELQLELKATRSQELIPDTEWNGNEDHKSWDHSNFLNRV